MMCHFRFELRLTLRYFWSRLQKNWLPNNGIGQDDALARELVVDVLDMGSSLRFLIKVFSNN
jgi:hypothetical protein